MAFAASILSARTAERIDRMLSTRKIEVQSPEQPGVRQVTIVEVIGPVGTDLWTACKVRVIRADGLVELHSAECQFGDLDTVYAPGQTLWAMRCGSDTSGKPRYLVTGRPALMHRWGGGNLNSTFEFLNRVRVLGGVSQVLPSEERDLGIIAESSVKVPRAGIYEIDARFVSVLSSQASGGNIPLYQYSWRAWCLLELVNDDGTADGVTGDVRGGADTTEFARGQGVVSTTFDSGPGTGIRPAGSVLVIDSNTNVNLQTIMMDVVSGGSFSLRTHASFSSTKTTIRLRIFCMGDSGYALEQSGLRWVQCYGRGSMRVVSAARTLNLQPALPPQPNPYSPPPPPAATYSIAGTLNDPGLYQSTHVSATMNLTGPVTRSITTGSALANPFSFATLPQGTYTLTCSNATAVPASRSITIGPNATGQNFEIPSTTGQIYCNVWIDADGNGQAGQGESAPGRSVTIAGPVTKSSTTNGNGDAFFNGLPSGTYTVSVALGATETCATNGASLFVNPQGVSSAYLRIDVPISDKFVIAGWVRDSAGVSQGGYTVNGPGGSVLTVAGQKWAFNNLVAGTYQISCQSFTQNITVGPSTYSVLFTV